MSPAHPRTRPPAALAAASMVVALLLVAAILLAILPDPASAAAALTATMDRSLTLVDESAALTVSGDVIASLGDAATIEVSITGPAGLSEIQKPDSFLPHAGGFTLAAGSLPAVARPSATELHLPVPTSNLPLRPGAFRVTVDVWSNGIRLASGSTWMARIGSRTEPLDLAFVWRAELGVHRDPSGRFIDTDLQRACAADGALASLAALSSRFPEWRFSLGIEPVLLTQLRDLADGYTAADGSEAGVAVSADDQTAKDAKAVLAALAAAGAGDAVEMAGAPYANADLGLLASRPDWRDGFEQVQLGKQELVQALGLGLSPAGAFSPSLDLGGNTLGDYGQATIDHVLVDASVTADLNEEVPSGTLAVRAHDDANDRVTLVLADSDLRAVMAAPWDPSTLFAAMAAVLATGDRAGLVLTPGPEFTLPPQAFLDAIGNELKKDPWIRTQTMAGLLSAHPPGTRPVLLTRTIPLPTGYIAETILSAIQSAHAALDDLATAADPASLALESARRALYMSESRWWYRRGVSPEQASAGLAYALEAQTISRSVLEKVTLTGVKGSRIFGHDGTVTVAARNGGDSVMNVELQLSGAGLSFPEGEVVKARLEPGDNNVTVQVEGTSRSRTMTVRMVVGKAELGDQSASLRFITIVDLLPWIGAAAAAIVLLALVSFLVWRRRRKRGR